MNCLTPAQITPPPFARYQVETIQELEDIVMTEAAFETSTIRFASVAGFYKAGDGGHGEFIWDAASVLNPIAGIYIKPTNITGAGRWKRLITGFACNPKWTGAKLDGIADDAKAIQTAIDFAGVGGVVQVPIGTAKLTVELTTPSYCTVAGAGVGKTIFNQVTAGFRVFAIDSVSFVTLRDFSINVLSAIGINILSTTGNALYNVLENIEVQSLGAAGTGISLESNSNLGFVGFCQLKGIIVSGGNPASWGTKIGIRIGRDSVGYFHVVRTSMDKCRVFRTNIGIFMDNCDTVMADKIGLDDINGIELKFNKAGYCCFDYVAFEQEPVATKYIEFGANSADNFVNGSLANAGAPGYPTVTDAGTRNSWVGSDGSGGVLNQFSNGPARWVGNLTMMSRFMFGPSGTFGNSSDSANDGASVHLGSIICQRKSAPASSAEVTNWDFGGSHNSTGPGGSSVTQNYLFPWTASRPAMYLAFCLSVSTAGGPTKAVRISLFIETASGTFTEFNILYQVTGGASIAFGAPVRAGDDIQFNCNVLTNDGTSANVTRNFVRF